MTFTQLTYIKGDSTGLLFNFKYYRKLPQITIVNHGKLLLLPYYVNMRVVKIIPFTEINIDSTKSTNIQKRN